MGNLIIAENGHCSACDGQHRMAAIVACYEEDLLGLGIAVRLHNGVVREWCSDCGEEMFIVPDEEGLVAVVAMTRALMPEKLNGREIKFLRKALDMASKEFADELEVTPETVSRWENDAAVMGPISEKLLRHTVCAQLHERAPAIVYEPKAIATMRIRPMSIEQSRAPMEFERIKLKVREQNTKLPQWDSYEPQAA